MNISQNSLNGTAPGTGELVADCVPWGDGGRPTPGTSSEARTGGVKLVLLRPPREAERESTMPATAEMRLDLQAPIDNLRSIRGDLEVYYWERPSRSERPDSERYQISLWIRQVTERTAALEGILMHMGAHAVVLTGVSPAEQNALASAADLLDQWIPEEAPFDGVLRDMAEILNAADRICLRAAGGRPDPGARRPIAT